MLQLASDFTKLSTRVRAAAAMLLRAIRSPTGLDTRVSMYIGPSHARSSLSTSVFTPAELLDAMDLLTRRGLVPAYSRCPQTRVHRSAPRLYRSASASLTR